MAQQTAPIAIKTGCLASQPSPNRMDESANAIKFFMINCRYTPGGAGLIVLTNFAEKDKSQAFGFAVVFLYQHRPLGVVRLKLYLAVGDTFSHDF